MLLLLGKSEVIDQYAEYSVQDRDWSGTGKGGTGAGQRPKSGGGVSG